MPREHPGSWGRRLIRASCGAASVHRCINQRGTADWGGAGGGPLRGRAGSRQRGIVHSTAEHFDERARAIAGPADLAGGSAGQQLRLVRGTMRALTDAAPDDVAGALREILAALTSYAGASTGAVIECDQHQTTWRVAAQHGAVDHASLPPVATIDIARQLQPDLSSPAGDAWSIVIPCWHQGVQCAQVVIGGSGPAHTSASDPLLTDVGRAIGMLLHHARQIDDGRIEQRQLRAVVDTMVEGVVLADRCGQIVLANRAAVAALAIGSLDVRRITLEEMPLVYDIHDMHGVPLPAERLPIARALRGECFFDERIQIGDHAGNFHVVACSGAPVLDDSASFAGAVVVFRDVTPQTARERARDDVLAIAAHELRSPLAAIHGFAQLLHDQRDAPADVTTRGLVLLTQQTGQALALVDRLLGLSRLDAAELILRNDRIDCRELVRQVVAHHHTPHQPLAIHDAAAGCVVQGDALCLREVLVNLIDNARRHSGQRRASLTLRTVDAAFLTAWVEDARNLPGRHAAHPACAPASHYAVIDVADAGVGICAERLCQLFRRHPRGAHGLGIGLYLCRELVVRHGGTILVESHEHQGSCFSVILPLAEGMPSRNIREEGS